MRILFWLLLIVVVWAVLSARSRAKPSGSARPTPSRAVPMVACAYCQLHVPQNEAVDAGGRWYCCEEHKRLGAGR